MLETPFRSLHESHGARMVDFAGWYMPVQYTSIVAEHLNVRARCGLFDVSHMGRIFISGPQHVAFTDHVATNSRASMKKGQVRYNLICNESGLILDDVLITASKGDGFVGVADMQANAATALLGEGTLIVCNAGNHPKIAEWLHNQTNGFEVAIHDASRQTAMLALQGPASEAILQPLTSVDLAKVKYYRCAIGTVFGVADVIISRTGYTGEDGFELIFPVQHADDFWKGLIEAGAPNGLTPAGLGCRDTLRLEAGMPLYGHEIDDHVNPIEAGLDWAVDLSKDFIGKHALAQVKAEGPLRRLVGLEIDGKRIARQGMKVLSGNSVVGQVASGTKSPTLDKQIATALVTASLAQLGTPLNVEIKEGQSQPAKVIETPFYKRKR